MRKLVLAILVFAVALLGVGYTAGKPSVQAASQATTEQYSARLDAAVPYPLAQMNDSLERRQLRERLLRFNAGTKIAYINLLAQTGQVIASFPIKGKVSSVDSQLTTAQLLARKCFSTGCIDGVVNAPQDDGSYNTNGSAVFFFTTADVYMEWNGLYLMTDAPLRITSAPVIVLPGDAKPTSTSASGH